MIVNKLLIFSFSAIRFLARRFVRSANGKCTESFPGKWTNKIVQIRQHNNRTGKTRINIQPLFIQCVILIALQQLNEGLLEHLISISFSKIE